MRQRGLDESTPRASPFRTSPLPREKCDGANHRRFGFELIRKFPNFSGRIFGRFGGSVVTRRRSYIVSEHKSVRVYLRLKRNGQPVVLFHARGALQALISAVGEILGVFAPQDRPNILVRS